MNPTHAFKKVMLPLALTVLIAGGAVAYTVAEQPKTTEKPAAAAPAAAPEAAPAAKGEHGAETGAAAHTDEVTLTAEAITKNQIKVEAARKQALSEVYIVPARISYNTEQMAHVGTPVTGRVAELKVKLGDTVKKGDELLVIDSPALGESQSDYLQKKTQVEVAQSNRDVAQTAAERAKRLFEGKGIALGEFQKREGDFKAACGALKSAEAALTAAENSLHLWGITQADVAHLVKTGEINPRYTVRAPMAGTVIKRESTLGEIVGPERDALLILADMRTLWVLADVPENTIHKIAPGASALVDIESLKGQHYKGKVTYIAPELDKATRTAQVRVEVADGNTPLMPGMFAQVRINAAGKAAKAMLGVTEQAIQTVEGSSCVFVAVDGKEGLFVKRPVQIGPTMGGLVPILSGLKDGEKVVVAGSFILKAEIGKSSMDEE